MTHRSVLIAVPVILGASLTACSDSPPTVTAPSTTAASSASTPAPTGSDSTTPSPSDSMTSPPSSSSAATTPAPGAPAANPIPGATIRVDELAPTAMAAQNAQGTFQFNLKAGTSVDFPGSARCVGTAAWTLKQGSREQINVGGKSYRRSSASAPYSVTTDREPGLQDDNPCNFLEIFRDQDRSTVLRVVSRDASTEGRSGLMELRSEPSSTSATYVVYLEASRRPVRVDVTNPNSSSPRSIVYRDYGVPVEIVAPTNTTTASPGSAAATTN